MKIIKLTRNVQDEKGTKGSLSYNGKDICKTLELPWNSNSHKISCIPIGKYSVTKWNSIHLHDAYEVQNVPNRTGICLHCGNYAGDVRLGLKSDSEGCILFATTTSSDGNQYVGIGSRTAHDVFMVLLQGEDFVLDIINNLSK